MKLPEEQQYRFIRLDVNSTGKYHIVEGAHTVGQDACRRAHGVRHIDGMRRQGSSVVRDPNGTEANAKFMWGVRGCRDRFEISGHAFRRIE